MEFRLLNNTMIATQDEKGQWIYKANSDNRLKPFTTSGRLKAVYKDLPRFKVIAQFEKQEMQDFTTSIGEAVKEISHKLLSFSQ